MTVHKYSLVELQQKAYNLADKVVSPVVILLNGNLGVGKTTFAQFFINQIINDKSEAVTSPTFNIVQIYETVKGPVWHVDLYRIKSKIELTELGILEAMHQYICLIEWPELIRKYTESCEVINIDL